MPELGEGFEALGRTRTPDVWREIEQREPRPMPPSPRPRRVIAIVVAFLVAATGLGLAGLTFSGSTPPVRPSSGVANGRIAFVAFDGSAWQIYSVEPDGVGLAQLTDVSDRVVTGVPTWSPDGSRIAYVVQELDPDGTTGRSDIWIMNADGTDPRPITDGPGSSWEPAWSSDGSLIAFTHGSDIYTMTPEGAETTNLTANDEQLPGGQHEPTWSPDGMQIAFVSRGADDDLYVMRADGSDVRTLFSGPGYQSELAWSPDGATIAFANVTEESGSDVGEFTLIDPNGEVTGRLSGLPPMAQAPMWSPDGRWIVFMANVAGSDREAIYVMDEEGTGIHEVAGLPRDASWPAWQAIPFEPRPQPGPFRPMANGPIYFRVGGADGGSRVESIQSDGTDRHVVFSESSPVHYSRIDFSPDGTRIAFDNFLVGQYGIETADPDGSHVVRLTDGVNDSWASWSPDGTKILFSSTGYDPSIEQCTPGFPHEHGCPTDIYVMDADGSNVVRLTDDPASEYQPVWSPDGRRIAFARSLGDPQLSHPAIFTMDPDGTDVRQTSSAESGSDFWPSWSPDGTQIVFAAIRREDWGIWAVDADGSNERLILGGTGAGYVDNPVWSPDGSLIAFVGNLAVDDYSPADALYVMRPDGTDVTPIADAPGIGVAGDIAWQPIQSPAETVEPTPSIPPATAELVETFAVGHDVRSVVYGGGSVWVAASNDDGSSLGRIVRIDPETHQVQADIPVEVIPTWVVGGGAMVVSEGSLWVTGAIEGAGVDGISDAAVIRIDASTNEVAQTFNLGGQVGADLTFLGGDLWVLVFGDDGMEVARVAPETGDLLDRIPLTSTWGHTIVGAYGRLFVIEGGSDAVNIDARVAVIDPITATVTRGAKLPTGGEGPVLWQQEPWIESENAFARIDPQTGDVKDLSASLDQSRFAVCCLSIEADDRGIWFLGFNGKTGAGELRLDVFDPASGETTELVALDEGSPVAMAVAPDSVWILNNEGTLTHVDLG